MINNILLYFNRRKLEKMIERKMEYNEIVKQSQKVDKYVNKKMKCY